LIFFIRTSPELITFKSSSVNFELKGSAKEKLQTKNEHKINNKAFFIYIPLNFLTILYNQ
jgi:hypothetical protein